MTNNIYIKQLADLQERLNNQMLIHDFVKEIMKEDTIEDILWSICQNVISRLGFEDCVIYLLDEETELLVQKAAYGPKNPNAKDILNQITIPLGKGVVGTVAASGIAEIINDTSKDDRYITDDECRLSEIAVPIFYKNNIIGVIDSEHAQKDFYNESDLQMLETISSLCATKIGSAIAHRELMHYKNKLEQLVNERTLELNDTIERLGISNENLERYAHTVSHDLKSPLLTITSFLDLIEKKETNLSETSKEYMFLINEAAGRMNNLLVEILRTSIKTNNKFTKGHLDLNNILEDVVNNLSFEIDKNNVEIEVIDNLPKFWGLESHFIQIFQNVISNSVKYKIPKQKQKIIISCKRSNKYIQLKFQDFGIGLKQKFLESIFELGERRNFRQKGRGIGLNTCKKIVEGYEGNIKATSQGLNQGLSIIINLPTKITTNKLAVSSTVNLC